MILAFSKELEKSEELLNKVSAGFKENYMFRIGFLLLMILKKQPYDLDVLKDDKVVLWARNDFQYSHIISEIYSLTGDIEKALDWLENSFERGFVNYPFLDSFDPFLENIRHEDRFKKLIGRVKVEYEQIC